MNLPPLSEKNVSGEPYIGTQWENKALKIASGRLEGINARADTCVAWSVMQRRILPSKNLRSMATTSWNHEAVWKGDYWLGFGLLLEVAIST